MSSTQTGGSTAEQAKETAQNAAEQAKQTAQQATQQARGRVRDQVDRRSTEAGEQATSVADAIRQSAQQLREQGKEGVAKPIEQAADQVQRAGSWLRDADGDRILNDVEDFARSKPMIVLAGSAVVGFALSRLLKASSTQRYGQRSGNGGTATPGYGTTAGPYGAPGYGTGAERDRLPASVPPVGGQPPIGTPGGTTRGGAGGF
jgi:vacuolar-type H+-ATPase subunit E/Vma4